MPCEIEPEKWQWIPNHVLTFCQQAQVRRRRAQQHQSNEDELRQPQHQGRSNEYVEDMFDPSGLLIGV